ncbi:hypothetical protein PV10_00499 [Exophiala mesophila]|uniref:RecF/RecN/SMC N-terminal domain-containing protein n=1 Tax=Exophiala mesophila TaxID=212818 RepID=A0A0D1Y7G7_EXOME|nr:uncharacterized protein PV10_00499 [Exophiala mesophila]KIV96661.1 hypothetical protein PV10_00499 [Exophiala mesophila]
MAPSKRPAPLDPDDDDDGFHEDQSSHLSESTPGSAANKRRRISDVSSNQSEPDNGSTPPSDLDSDDDLDNSEDEAAATQALRAKAANQKNKGNEPAEFGILEAVELKNFMCHAEYFFKLGPLINFICGKNGSGKSALLTAITLCLGGKASATNRGARLQDFIKEGESQASIVCVLKNQGEAAYKPEEYGKSIRVERHFSRTGTGSSTYKIKSEKGRIISTRRADLEDICDHMMLQIDNPMNVLSQDQARQFLSSSSPAEKYKLFMKGVQLEQLDQDYKLIEEQSENIRAKIEAKLPDLEPLKKQMDSANTKLALSNKHDGTYRKIRELRRMLAWIQVQDQEKIRDEYQHEIDDANAKIAEAEHRAAELDALFQQADQEATRATEAFNLMVSQLELAKDEKKEHKDKIDKIKSDVSAALTEQRAIRSLITTTEQEIASTLAEISAEETRLAELDGGGAAARVHDLQQARDSLDAALDKRNTHLQQTPQLTEALEDARKFMNEAKEAKMAQQERCSQQRDILRQMQQNRNSLEAAFHPNMPNLLRALSRTTGFQQKPIGPLGKHVKLLKQEWSSILEKSFGSSLNAFLVSNKRDEKLLSDIMRQQRCVTPIFISNTQAIDTTSKEPDARFDTVLRTLQIDDEMVKKQLVIAHGIEQTILIPDMTEASRELFANGQPLKNVRRCYCFNPHSRQRGFVLMYKGRGEAAQDPIQQYDGLPRMKSDVEETIRRQQAAVEESRAQLHELEVNHTDAQARVSEAEHKLGRHKRESRELEIAVQQCQDRIETLQDAIKDDSVHDGKLEILRQKLEDAREQKAIHGSSFQDTVTPVDDLSRLSRAAHEKDEILEKQINRVKEMVAEAQIAAQKAGKKRAHDLGEKNAAMALIEDGRADRASLQRKLDEHLEQLANYVEQASVVCERINIPPDATYDALHKKYNRLRSDYDAFQAEIGASREKIISDAAKYSEIYNKAKKEIENLESLRDQLHDSLTERKVRWKEFRGHITARTKTQFTYMLSERSFRGQVIMDHRQKLMDIQVEPDITKRSGEGRSARTLSGGEKSFSQICLLLAIWEAMGSPIRCLDEFDVYMDAVNRTTSINLLIEAARQSIGRQFVLISPGNKSDIKMAKDVTAVEVAAPERGQARLAFAAA